MKKIGEVGLCSQLVEYGSQNDINVKGEIPGIFYLMNTDSKSEFPMYFLNHMLTYLRSGIDGENIILPRLDDPLLNKGAGEIYSRACDLDENSRIKYLQDSLKNYTVNFQRLRKKYLESREINLNDSKEEYLEYFLAISKS